VHAASQKPDIAERGILLAVAVLGLLVVVVSFMPWMAYGYAAKVSISGTHMKGFTDAGDGWVTAIAGAAAALLATGALLWELRGQLLASVITVPGIVIAAIAGYDLIKPWEGPRPGFLGFWIIVSEFEVTRGPALWTAAAAGLAIAIAGTVFLITANRRRPPLDSPAEHWETRAWA
jgi:hypothetical protein